MWTAKRRAVSAQLQPGFRCSVPRVGLLRHLYSDRDHHFDLNLHAVGLGDRNEHLNPNRDGDVDGHAGTHAHLACKLPADGASGLRPVSKREPGLRVQPELAMRSAAGRWRRLLCLLRSGLPWHCAFRHLRPDGSDTTVRSDLIGDRPRGQPLGWRHKRKFREPTDQPQRVGIYWFGGADDHHLHRYQHTLQDQSEHGNGVGMATIKRVAGWRATPLWTW